MQWHFSSTSRQPSAKISYLISSELPSSAIASANVEVKKVLDDEKGGQNGRKRTRGSYKKLSAEDLR